MNNSICYVKIFKSENEAVEDNALRVFIKMKRHQDGGKLVFGDCSDDVDEFYIIWNENRINEVIESFKKTGVQMEYKNVTNDTLKGLYDEKFIEVFSSEKHFSELLVFMRNNISVDSLLDKMIEKGENSLSEFEKKYLSIASHEKS